jgi:Fe2+ or Zn2+ uptake regulation protein
MRKSYAHLDILARRMPRPSPVTDEVRRLIGAGDRHAWSIEDLHQAVRANLGSADYSSVFRAVSMLERQGKLDRIELGDGLARFEVRDDHHEHIRCERCGRIEEVPVCVLDHAAAQVQGLTGFRVTSHRVVFGGLCEECALLLTR